MLGQVCNHPDYMVGIICGVLMVIRFAGQVHIQSIHKSCKKKQHQTYGKKWLRGTQFVIKPLAQQNAGYHKACHLKGYS